MTVLKYTERDLLDMLHARYSKVSMGSSLRYVVAEHVPNRVVNFGLADDDPVYKFIADFLAHDTQREYLDLDGRRMSHAYGRPDKVQLSVIAGHEIKVSRSDWLKELRQPEKAEAWKKHCHKWYLVAPKDIATVDELPPGWGWLAPQPSGVLRTIVHAPLLTPVPMPQGTTLAWARAVQATSRRIATRGLTADPSA